MTRDFSPPEPAAEEPVTPSELERSSARLYVLAEVSHAFATVATDYDSLLEKIARTTAELIGDGCQVTLLDSDGESLVNAANAHRDPGLEADYRGYLAGVGVPKLSSAAVSAVVARTGTAKLVPAIDPATLVAQADQALKPLVARLNVHSFAVVPIRARGAVIGTISIMRSGPGRGYTVDDLTLLEDLAGRAGLAIENARLYGELERRVRQRTAELETANEELEAFSSSVAHDLRAPLRWIDGFAQALLEDQGERLDEQGRDHLDRIRRASQRMGVLIDDLLSLSRISRTPIERQRIDLGALAVAVIDNLRQHDPDRQVRLEVAPGLVTRGDPALVPILLENLLSNAWKFSARRPQATIELGRTQTATGTAFYVRDDGAGFDMSRAGKLFQPFQRLHGTDEFEGTGVGLATVHRIVTRHGGRIWAEAKPGAGATFLFTLGEDR
jgi:signal transduction histidine kinase